MHISQKFVQSIRTKCLSVLYYGLEACPLTKVQTKSLDYALHSCFRKIFSTKEQAVVHLCMVSSARAACMPRGLPACVNFLSFKIKLLSKENSGSAKPIFTKFSAHDRYLIVYCRFDPFFRRRKDQYQVKIGKIGLFICIRSPCITNYCAILIFKSSFLMTWLHYV